MGMEPKRERQRESVSVGVRGGNGTLDFFISLFVVALLVLFKERRGTRGPIQSKARATRANLS